MENTRTENKALRIFFIICTILIIGTFGAGFTGLILTNWALAGAGYGTSMALSFICFIITYNLKAREKSEEFLGKNPKLANGKIVATKKGLDFKTLDVYVDINGVQAFGQTKNTKLNAGQEVVVLWNEETKKCKIKKVL